MELLGFLYFLVFILSISLIVCIYQIIQRVKYLKAKEKQEQGVGAHEARGQQAKASSQQKTPEERYQDIVEQSYKVAVYREWEYQKKQLEQRKRKSEQEERKRIIKEQQEKERKKQQQQEEEKKRSKEQSIRELQENERRELVSEIFDKIDYMEGTEFENFCARLLVAMGHSGVQTTAHHGDGGADIISEYNGAKYAFQCKRYEKNVPNKAVQEAYSGKGIYHTDKAVVITNSHFTKEAIKQARALDVELWDRHGLSSLVYKYLPRLLNDTA